MNDLGDFLRSRRAAIRPEDVGVTPFGRRRVPGLRREELAALAGVSPDYYTRVEQGRARPSWEILEAIGRVLGLAQDEQAHLWALARPRSRPTAPLVVRQSVQHLLATIGDDIPAYILGPRTEVLAYNRLAEEVICPFGRIPPHDRYMVRIVFLEPFVRERHRDWERTAAQIVGLLRLNASHEPNDARLTELVGELTVRSPKFAALWSHHHVHDKSSGRKLLTHPDVGDFELAFDTLRLVENPSFSVVMLTPDAGSPDETSLRLISASTLTPSKA